QRGIERASALQHTLYLGQLGMLRKYDLLEVVRDPGMDEVEKQGLGPAPAPGRDTGRTTQPRRKPAAELIHSIGRGRTRQFSGSCEATVPARPDGCGGTGVLARSRLTFIPIGECLRRRDPDLWCCDHDGARWNVRRGINLFSSPNAQNRSPNQEQREV